MRSALIIMLLALSACASQQAPTISATPVARTQDNVASYKVGSYGKLNNVQQTDLHRQYGLLPGTVIKGSKRTFTVRKVVYSGGVYIVAMDTQGQGLKEIGSAIIRQTDCFIPHNSRVTTFNIGISRYGASFYCRKPRAWEK